MSAAIALVDYGMGNLPNVARALERAGCKPYVTDDPDRVRRAERLVVPGVGACGDAMRALGASGLGAALVERIRQGTPFLGICLGLQLLLDSAEEGDCDCLGVVPGRVAAFPRDFGLPVPHMGWNQLSEIRPDPLLAGVSGLDYVYFVHSFAVPLGPYSVASTDYGGAITAVARRDNFCGTQFHPERSGVVGARILANFLKTPV